MSEPPTESPRPGLRILFLGTPDAAVPTLRELRREGFPVPLVVTRPDRPKGRGKTLAASPVKEAALAEGLEVYEPEDVNEEESVARLAACEPDVLLIVAYGRILKKAVLAVPSRIPLNLHFSLLPEYRGAAPVAAAIADGRTVTGVTIQRVVRKLDAGPVLDREEVAIRPGETAGELEGRLAEVGARLTVRALRAVEAGTAVETEQDHDRATVAPMLAKADGRMDFSRPAAELSRHVRAMDPWPGATCRFAGPDRKAPRPVTILAAREIVGDGPPVPSGEVVEVRKDGIVVATGDGRVAILRLKPAGKGALTAREFANGYHVKPGDRFE